MTETWMDVKRSGLLMSSDLGVNVVEEGCDDLHCNDS